MRLIEQIVNNSICTNNFSRVYPYINKFLMENGDSLNSRAGHTREILNFKTEICNPYQRCVGNNGRDINIFFLLAEAIWIFTGRKDVEFLTLFNSRMSDFSDDGKVFHAPYGFRLRHYGVHSSAEIKTTSPENNGHDAQQRIEGTDQILTALKMLSSDTSDRRVVMSIWNTDLDLNTKSKDIPCNDLVMLKIRNGKLHTTIANRSNDLHWGLPTNLFQFSFITEIMSNILGIELGTQTHNSQSLHIYTENPISFKMYENLQLHTGDFPDLYDFFAPARMDMNFEIESIEGKLNEVDFFLNSMINHLQSGTKMSETEYRSLNSFSRYFGLIYDLLNIYLSYKNSENKTDQLKWDKLQEIGKLCNYFPHLDILGLAGNFFTVRIKNEELKSKNFIEPLGKL